MSTTAADVTTITTDDVTSNATDLMGVCENVPASIHVDIQYARAGVFNDSEIYSVVGAKVRCVFNHVNNIRAM